MKQKQVWCLRLWLVLSIGGRETGVFNTTNQERVESHSQVVAFSLNVETSSL